MCHMTLVNSRLDFNSKNDVKSDSCHSVEIISFPYFFTYYLRILIVLIFHPTSVRPFQTFSKQTAIGEIESNL